MLEHLSSLRFLVEISEKLQTAQVSGTTTPYSISLFSPQRRSQSNIPQRNDTDVNSSWLLFISRSSTVMHVSFVRHNKSYPRTVRSVQNSVSMDTKSLGFKRELVARHMAGIRRDVWSPRRTLRQSGHPLDKFMSRSDFYVGKKCKAIVVECLNLCTGLIKRSEVVGRGASHVHVTVTAQENDIDQSRISFWVSRSAGGSNVANSISDV